MGDIQSSDKQERKHTRSKHPGGDGRVKQDQKKTKPYKKQKFQKHSEGSGRRPHSGKRSMGNFLKPKYSDPVYTQKENKDFVLFWQKGSVFSQWHHSMFTVEELTFNCAEQFMMYHKTRLCDDEKLTERVMTSTDPEEQKDLGRQAAKLPSFNRPLWNSKCEEIVKQGNIAKFSQNPKLKAVLLNTGNKTLAEASPFDEKWGIGLAADNPDALNKEKWRGTNLLGTILMDVRGELYNDQIK